METRLVVAYALILILALLIGGVIFYATRDGRAYRRQHVRSNRSRRSARDARRAAEEAS
jgi:CHASE3 domain sensor protein